MRMNVGYRLRDDRDRLHDFRVVRRGKTFQEDGRLSDPTPGLYEVSDRFRVSRGQEAALVKVAGKEVNTTCIFGLRIDADYREPAGGFRPVKITYVWEEDGQAKTDVHVATQPKETYVNHLADRRRG